MAHHSFHHHESTENDHGHPGVLDVILVVSNTQRYESRYRHFKRIKHELEQNYHVRLTIVEIAFGSRPHVIAKHDNPRHLLLRSPDEIWHKEQMINLGIKRLPHDWKYVCWYDADVSFINHTWASETVEALQHYQVVQPWSHAIDLGPSGETFATYTSFGYCYQQGLIPAGRGHKKYYAYPHTGYVWAARREAIDCLGGLIDTAILGAGDHHMAWSLIGRADDSLPQGITEGYRKPIKIWEDRANQHIKHNVGFVAGTLAHHFHGKKRDRGYVSRWDVLVSWQYDPATDLTLDWQGLWKLRVESKRQIELRDGIRDYMKSRNEDSIDTE